MPAAVISSGKNLGSRSAAIRAARYPTTRDCDDNASMLCAREMRGNRSSDMALTLRVANVASNSCSAAGCRKLRTSAPSRRSLASSTGSGCTARTTSASFERVTISDVGASGDVRLVAVAGLQARAALDRHGQPASKQPRDGVRDTRDAALIRCRLPRHHHFHARNLPHPLARPARNETRFARSAARFNRAAARAITPPRTGGPVSGSARGRRRAGSPAGRSWLRSPPSSAHRSASLGA